MTHQSVAEMDGPDVDDFDADYEALLQQLTADFRSFLVGVRAQLSARDSRQQRLQVALCQRERSLRLREDQLLERIAAFAQAQLAQQEHAEWLNGRDEQTVSPRSGVAPRSEVPNDSASGLSVVNGRAEQRSNERLYSLAEEDHRTSVLAVHPAEGYGGSAERVTYEYAPRAEVQSALPPTRAGAGVQLHQRPARAGDDRRHTVSSWPAYGRAVPEGRAAASGGLKEPSGRHQASDDRLTPARPPDRHARLGGRGRSRSSPDDHRSVAALRDLALGDIAERQRFGRQSPPSYQPRPQPSPAARNDVDIRPKKPIRIGSVGAMGMKTATSVEQIERAKVAAAPAQLPVSRRRRVEPEANRQPSYAGRMQPPKGYDSSAKSPSQLRPPGRYSRPSEAGDDSTDTMTNPLLDRSFSGELPHDESAATIDTNGAYESAYLKSPQRRNYSFSADTSPSGGVPTRPFYEVAPTYKRMLRDLAAAEVSQPVVTRSRARSLPVPASAAPQSLPRTQSSRLRKKISNYKAYVKEVQGVKSVGVCL